MVVVGSPVIPFVPFRGNSELVDGSVPRRTSFPSEASGDESAAKGRHASDARRRSPENGGQVSRLRVNYGFLTQLIVDDTGGAPGRKISSSNAVHRQAFIAYQSAQGIIGSDDPPGRDVARGWAANKAGDLGKAPTLDLMA